jgi:hypothetical protein
MIAALERIAASLGSLETISNQLGGGGNSGGGIEPLANIPGLVRNDVPREALAYPRQSLFILHGLAQGKVRLDGRGINVTADVKDFSGRRIATRLVNASTSAHSAEELMRLPATPVVRKDEQNLVEEVAPTTTEKGVWTFADGSTITAIGKGTSHVWKQRDGSAVAADAANLVVTEGTGAFKGARGLVSLLGITYTAPGQASPFSTPGGAFGPQHSIEVFQLSMGEDI